MNLFLNLKSLYRNSYEEAAAKKVFSARQEASHLLAWEHSHE